MEVSQEYSDAMKDLAGAGLHISKVRRVVEAILNAAQDGKEPCVAVSRDPAEYAKRVAALSMKKCEQIEKMAKALLLGEPVNIPEPDTADGDQCYAVKGELWITNQRG